MQVLELAILVHSVIIGVSLGASVRSSTIRPLVGALSFHQFFEGIGLGGCIVQDFRCRTDVNAGHMGIDLQNSGELCFPDKAGISCSSFQEGWIREVLLVAAFSRLAGKA
ncbi:hypothetical protein GUJ93_ZPchr0458g22383 [Zizania palustris]|uniref:Uncharacterized protein n=1 Tax=Zizania palustris TaxID=103762 RepID=A0A8J5VDV4_ZIZPA|nr:hypothetical protein GUJ93_ZPchr0458g22383 [Zizania palustris]